MFFSGFHVNLHSIHAGSGDLAATGILEDGFKHSMEVRLPHLALTSSSG